MTKKHFEILALAALAIAPLCHGFYEVTTGNEKRLLSPSGREPISELTDASQLLKIGRNQGPAAMEKAFEQFELTTLGSAEAVAALEKKLKENDSLRMTSPGWAGQVLARSSNLTEKERRVLFTLLDINRMCPATECLSVRRILERHSLQNEWQYQSLHESIATGDITIPKLLAMSRLLDPDATFSTEAGGDYSALDMVCESISHMSPEQKASLATDLERSGEKGFGREFLAACCRIESHDTTPLFDMLRRHKPFLEKLPKADLQAIVRQLKVIQDRPQDVFRSPSDAEYVFYGEIHRLAHPEDELDLIIAHLSANDSDDEVTVAPSLAIELLRCHFHHAITLDANKARRIRDRAFAELSKLDPQFDPVRLETALLDLVPLWSNNPHMLVYVASAMSDPCYANRPLLLNRHIRRAVQHSLPDLESPEKTAAYLDVINAAKTGSPQMTAFWLCLLNTEAQENYAILNKRRGLRKTVLLDTTATEAMLAKRIAGHPDDSAAKELLAGLRYVKALEGDHAAFEKNAAAASAIIKNEIENTALPPAYRYACASRLLSQLEFKKIACPQSLRPGVVEALISFINAGGTTDDSFAPVTNLIIRSFKDDPKSLKKIAEAIAPHFETILKGSDDERQIESLALLASLTRNDDAIRTILEAGKGDALIDNPFFIGRLLETGATGSIDLWLSERPDLPKVTPGEHVRRETTRIGWDKVPAGLSPHRTAYLAALLAGTENIVPYSASTDKACVALAERLIPILATCPTLSDEIKDACAFIITRELTPTSAALPALKDRFDPELLPQGLKQEWFRQDFKNRLDTSVAIALAEYLAGNESDLNAMFAHAETQLKADPKSSATATHLLHDAPHLLRRFLEDELATSEPGITPEWLPTVSKLIVPLCWYEGGLETKPSAGQTQLLLTHALFCAATDPEAYNNFIASLSEEDLRRYRQSWRRIHNTDRQLIRVLPLGSDTLRAVRDRAMRNIPKMPELLALLRSEGTAAPGATGALLGWKIQPFDLVRIEPDLLEPEKENGLSADNVVAYLTKAGGAGTGLADGVLLAVIEATVNSEYKADMILRRAEHLGFTMKQPKKAQEWLINIPATGLPQSFTDRRNATVKRLLTGN